MLATLNSRDIAQNDRHCNGDAVPLSRVCVQLNLSGPLGWWSGWIVEQLRYSSL